MTGGFIEITEMNYFNYLQGIIEYKNTFENKNLIKKNT
jgi:hypothetical protein